MTEPADIIREALENIGPCDTDAENPHHEVWCIAHRQKRCTAEADAKAAYTALATLTDQLADVQGMADLSHSEVGRLQAELALARESQMGMQLELEQYEAKQGVFQRERDEGEHCQDCGAAYSAVYRAPDTLWALISPKPAPAGLLCPTCAFSKAHEVIATLTDQLAAARLEVKGLNELGTVGEMTWLGMAENNVRLAAEVAALRLAATHPGGRS